MPFFERGDVRIHYTVSGAPDGFPVLALAPGGLRSTISRWASAPWNPLERLSGFRVIAMDQRNAGKSTGPVTADSGWATYTRDQLALLDHLGVEAFHAVGMCIGGPYVLRLLRAAPDRARAGVLLQPIGLADNRHAFHEIFDAWRGQIARHHPEADDAAWAAFRQAMWGGDFLFGVTREEAAACVHPVLLLAGDDLYHPAPVSAELAGILPDVTVVPEWKHGEALAAADRQIREFLRTYT